MARSARQLLLVVVVAVLTAACGAGSTGSTVADGLSAEPTTTTSTVARATTVVVEPSRDAQGVAVFGGEIEPGVPLSYGIYVHCGVDWLGEFNGTSWYIDGKVPPRWSEQVGGFDLLKVVLVLDDDPVPHIVATTSDGLNATYLPTDEQMPGCD